MDALSDRDCASRTTCGRELVAAPRPGGAFRWTEGRGVRGPRCYAAGPRERRTSLRFGCLGRPVLVLPAAPRRRLESLRY